MHDFLFRELVLLENIAEKLFSDIKKEDRLSLYHSHFYKKNNVSDCESLPGYI
jgi:hypothetical protein